MKDLIVNVVYILSQQKTFILNMLEKSIHIETAASDATPPGWSFNPSSWEHRIPLICISCIGFAIASYLALYQLGIFRNVWEPFFGYGSKNVLNSSVATLLPFPDALLGVLAYFTDIICSIIGGTDRWRSKPYIVVFFGLIVILLGITGILLSILQPVMFHSWCTLCLSSACCSVILVGPAMNEVLATLQYLKSNVSSGNTFWKTFWGIKNVGKSS